MTILLNENKAKERRTQITLNKSDLDILTRVIVAELKEELNNTLGIDRETHIQQHNQLAEFLEVYHNTKSKVLKMLFSLSFFITMSIIALFYFKK